MLNNLVTIAGVHWQKVQDEMRYSKTKGDDRLLRDFKTYKDMYNAKLQTQGAMAKELQRKNKILRENASTNSEQRQMFDCLRVLLAAKLKAKTQDKSQPTGSDDGVFDLGNAIGGA